MSFFGQSDPDQALEATLKRTRACVLFRKNSILCKDGTEVRLRSNRAIVLQWCYCSVEALPSRYRAGLNALKQKCNCHLMSTFTRNSGLWFGGRAAYSMKKW